MYGSKTQSAVKAFQKANGLKADGVAGEKTLAAIRNKFRWLKNESNIKQFIRLEFA